MIRSLFSILLISLSSANLNAAPPDWPRLFGTAQNHSEAKGVPLTWSETEHVKWKTALPGEGWSSPVIQGGQVWMTTATEGGKSLRVLCVDLMNGKLLRDVEVLHNDVVPEKHRRNSYASPTPVLDGERLYAHFGAMGTVCLSTRDASPLWVRRDLKIDHQNGPGGSVTLWETV
jgi:outer membrane protein assembly factor BamB